MILLKVNWSIPVIFFYVETLMKNNCQYQSRYTNQLLPYFMKQLITIIVAIRNLILLTDNSFEKVIPDTIAFYGDVWPPVL